MNWKRITIFTAILLLATFAASFPFGFIYGFLASIDKPVPTWLSKVQNIVVPMTAVIVFLFLAKKQESKPWLHALVVALFSWLVSFPINVLYFGQPVLSWAVAVVILFITLAIGTPIGNYLRNKSTEQVENA